MKEAASIGVEVGDVLAGKYRVERVLGAGGMGVVVEATHTVLADRVALKLLRAHVVQDPMVKARFLQEAQASVRIRSPHVARVLDVGELEGGAPYIVMEYLDGIDLDHEIERLTKLDPTYACDLMLQACEALAVAHAAGVIHRDVKPANLFLTRAADGSPLLKVLDFGISKVLQPFGGADHNLTQTQTAMGSPPYMSPEQMRSTKTVDSRTDLWSLGVVLYRALTGRMPFEAESMPELCALVLDANVPPLCEVAPELDPALAAVVHRCLAAAPAERYENVAALAEALAPFAGPGAAERAARVRRILANATGASAAVDSQAPGGSREGSTLDVTRRERPATEAATTPEKSGTGTAFGATRALSTFPRARPSLWLAVGALVAVLASFGVGLWIAQRPHDPAPSAPGGTASAAAPPLSTPAAAPTVSLAATEPVRSAAALPSSAGSITRGPVPRVPRAPQSAAPPRSTPGADPFASRH